MDELTLLHELTLFRDFRSDTPGPSAAETEAARARLFDAMAGQDAAAARLTSSRRRWAGLRRFTRTRFWAPVAAAAAVTAVVTAMVLLAAPSHSTTPTRKPSPASHEHPRHHASSRPVGGTSKLGGQHGLTGGPGQTGGQHAGTGAAGSGAPGAAGAPGTASSGPPTATTTTLTVSPETAFSAHQVVMTATVADQTGGNLSGGTVTFAISLNETVSPASELDVCFRAAVSYDAAAGDNVATCTYTFTSADAGPWLVRAGYTGYQQYEPSDSAAAPLTVTAIATQTTLTSVSPTEASPGQTVTLTATLTDQAGDNLTGGTVTFYWSPGSIDGVSTGGEANMCLHSPLTYNPAGRDNVATCKYTIASGMTAGTLDMQAGYSDPSGPYPGSTSGVVVFTVES